MLGTSDSCWVRSGCHLSPAILILHPSCPGRKPNPCRPALALQGVQKSTPDTQLNKGYSCFFFLLGPNPRLYPKEYQTLKIQRQGNCWLETTINLNVGHQYKLNLMCDFSSSVWGKDLIQMPNFAHFVLCMFVMQLEPSPARILPVSPLTKKKAKQALNCSKVPVLWVMTGKRWSPLLVLLQTLLEPLHLLKLNSSVLS